MAAEVCSEIWSSDGGALNSWPLHLPPCEPIQVTQVLQSKQETQVGGHSNFVAHLCLGIT